MKNIRIDQGVYRKPGIKIIPSFKVWETGWKLILETKRNCGKIWGVIISIFNLLCVQILREEETEFHALEYKDC